MLEYTLTGMSVIEPDIEAKELKTKSFINSDVEDANGLLLTENVEEQTELGRRTATKKRKSQKSKESSRKKVKGADYTKAKAISLQA